MEMKTSINQLEGKKSKFNPFNLRRFPLCILHQNILFRNRVVRNDEVVKNGLTRWRMLCVVVPFHILLPCKKANLIVWIRGMPIWQSSQLYEQENKTIAKRKKKGLHIGYFSVKTGFIHKKGKSWHLWCRSLGLVKINYPSQNGYVVIYKVLLLGTKW